MKTRLISVLLMLCSLFGYAQEQEGFVKKAGRPGKPGEPLSDVTVRVQGKPVTSVSDSTGNFSLIMAHYKTGQAYSLSRVSKQGYQLADDNLIGRDLPFSEDIPLEICMISREEYNDIYEEIEDKIRTKTDEEYQQQVASLKKQLEEKRISEQEHQEKYNELIERYDNIDNLIQKLAERYAKTDYDRLDSLGKQINSFIERGMLEEAEALILSKGTYEERKTELEKERQKKEQIAKALEMSEREYERKKNDLANDLYSQYDIACLRFDNIAAEDLLKKRMMIDTANVSWAIDYAIFIRDFMGRFDEAMNIFEKYLAKEKNNTVKADLYGNIGTTFAETGKMDKALQAYKLSMELREKDSLSSISLSTSYHNIASVYLSKEDYENYFHYISKADNLSLAQGDSIGLASLYLSRGAAYYNMGDYKKAEEYISRSLEMRKGLLGINNSQVATAYANLAVVMMQMSRYPEAQTYLRNALDIRLKLYGENHPYVAETHVSLGGLEIDMGNNKNALQYYEEAMAIYNEFYGEIHPEVALVYNKLGSYYSKIVNDFDKALYYYVKEKEISTQVYGYNTTHVANALNNIAYIYGQQQKYQEEYNTCLESINIYNSIYGPDNIYLTAPYNNIASRKYSLKEFDASEEYFKKCLNLYLKYYGENHENTALVYNNLAGVYIQTGQTEKAWEMLHKAKDIYSLVLGENHPKIAIPYDQIAVMMYNQKMYDKAEEYMLKALEIKLNAYGENHLDVAISYNNLSRIYINKQDYVKAEEMLWKAVEIYKNKFGENHIKVAEMLGKVRDLHSALKEYNKAIEIHKQACDIVEKLYGDAHPNTIAYQYKLVDLFHKAGEYEKGLPYILAACSNSVQVNGPNDRTTINCIMVANDIFFRIMGAESYDGKYNDEYTEFNKNLLVIATPAEGSYASKIGLNGKYIVVAYEEWTISDEADNFYVFGTSVNQREEKTYIFYKDGKYIKVPFTGRLGVSLNPMWVDASEKQAVIKSFDKTNKKKIKIAK